MISHILIGTRVGGRHCLLITNPDASKKTCIRSKVVVTVVQVASSHKFGVFFEYDVQSKIVGSVSLVIVPPNIDIHIDK